MELLAAKALPAPVDADRVTQRPVKPQRLRALAAARNTRPMDVADVVDELLGGAH